VSVNSTDSFRPAWWIPGTHLQTLWGRLLRTPVKARLRTERWRTPDSDFVDVVRLDAPAPSAPRVVLFHGLEGTIRSHYVARLVAELERRGWGMDLLLFRSCSGTPNETRRFYHSGDTADAMLVLERVVAEHPDAPLGLAGVSLGGNVLLKLLGERGPDMPSSVIGAATVSVPYDLALSCRRIERGFSRVYQEFFLRSLKRKAREKLARFPDLVEPARLERARTLWDFDDAITAPLHGFQDAADYYERSSSLGFLSAIRLPTLLLSARDDPFLPVHVLDDVTRIAASNPALHLEIAERGGHVGFVSGTVPWRPRYYAEWRIAEWFASLLPGVTRSPAAVP